MSQLASTDKIFVAGHRGMVGAAIKRKLESAGHRNLIVAAKAELDLRDQSSVASFFAKHRPDVVFLAAAKVGGILANQTFPAEFLYDNLQIQNNVIEHSHRNGVRKLVFLGSSCIYPKLAPQPIKEEYLLTGPLEPTNDAYAIAKIAGIMAIASYRRQYGLSGISLMPTNLYGPGDNFDLQKSHVLPAMLRKFHEAKLAGDAAVVLWGSGTPMREFLHVEDLADAAVFLANTYDSSEIVNVGTGTDQSIRELAELIQSIVGHRGPIEWDRTKPDGTPRKLLDVSRLSSLGWRAQISLREGIASTYQWYLANAR